MPGTSPPYDEWPVSDPEHSEREHLGVTGHEEQMVMVDKATSDIYVANVDHEAERIGNPKQSEWEVLPDESLGEFLERVGDEHGWEWLSEFARDHLEDES